MAKKGGDRKDWNVVQSRKRKATQPEAGRRDRSRVSEQRGGSTQIRVTDRRGQEDNGGYQQFNSRSRRSDCQEDSRVSMGLGRQHSPHHRRDKPIAQIGPDVQNNFDTGSKVAFYFTNFPEGIHVFQLRQYFEVCGILNDVYIARKINIRGQLYGFLRFENVRNVDKLALALNNVWIGQCRNWACEARFDQFSSDSDVVVSEERKVGGGQNGQVVVRVKSVGIKNVRVGKQAEMVRGEGEKTITVGKVEVKVDGVGR